MSEASEAASMDGDVSMESAAQLSEQEVIGVGSYENRDESDAPAKKEKTPDPYELARQVKHKVKVDGKEQEVDYDELVKRYEHVQAANKRMEKASQYEKLFRQMQQDPWSVLEQLGMDPDQVAEERLKKKIAREMMSEEERRLHDAEERLKQIEKERDEYKNRYSEYERRQAREVVRARIDTEITEAIEQSGIKPTPRLIAKVAELMLAKGQSSGQRVSASDVLKLANEHLTNDAKQYVTSLEPEDLMKLLPKKTLDAIRQNQVRQVVENSPIGKRHTPQSVETPQRKRRTGSTDDWFAKIESRL